MEQIEIYCSVTDSLVTVENYDSCNICYDSYEEQWQCLTCELWFDEYPKNNENEEKTETQ